MTRQDVEQRLEKLLQKLALPTPISVADIKEVIWNAADPKESSRLTLILTEHAPDEATAQEVIQVSQDSWNYFPHRMLGGKSPHDLVTEYQQTDKIEKPPPLPPKGKTLSDLFEDRYPKTIIFEKLNEDFWGWGFPKLYHELTEQLWNLEESKPSREVFEKELYRMIKQMPELFDAVNDLAHLYGVKREFGLAKTLYEQTIATARTYIPKTFIPGEDRALWPYLENRPFLRLLAGYAMLVEQRESVDKAIPLYEEILSFNPNDNQGIRSLLTTAYLKTNQPEKVIELTSHYPSDMMPETQMGTVLALITLKQEDLARKYLNQLKEYHSHLIKEILKPSHQKPLSYRGDMIARGSPEEAYAYWLAQGKLWEQTPGAIDFIAENAKEIKAQIITLEDKDVLAVDFFNDFLTFLNLLKERPIKLTATGNLSLKDIEHLFPQIATLQPLLIYAKDMGWKIRTEEELWPLHMIKVLAGIMHLTYKRRDKLQLSKNGLAFLNKLSPVDQYKQLVSHYWHQTNWAHFAASGWVRENKIKLCEELQKEQLTIWNMLLDKGEQWIDYQTFCDVLRQTFHLDKFLQNYRSDPDDIEIYTRHILFSYNLSLFGCVEIEETKGRYDTNHITRFRSTKLGLALYSKE